MERPSCSCGLGYRGLRRNNSDSAGRERRNVGGFAAPMLRDQAQKQDGNNDCPCGRWHRWKPSACNHLYEAFTGNALKIPNIRIWCTRPGMRRQDIKRGALLLQRKKRYRRTTRIFLSAPLPALLRPLKGTQERECFRRPSTH